MRKILYFIIFLLLAASLSAQQKSSLVYPKADQVLQDTNVRLQWDAAPDDSLYQITLATDSLFQNKLISGDSTSLNYLSLSLNMNYSYYWYVQYNSSNQYTDTFSFSTKTPLVIDSVKLWLAPEQGVVKDSNDRVSAWLNLIDSSLSFTQPAINKQPVFKDTSVYSLNSSIQFDGINDFLNGGDILDLNYNDRSVFIIGKSNSATGAFIAKSVAAGQVNRYSVFLSGSNFRLLYHDGVGNRMPSFPYSYGEFDLLSGVTNRNSSTNSLFINGVNVKDINNISDYTYYFNSTFRFLIGAYNNSSDNSELNHLNGNIAEILMIDDTLTVNEKKFVNKYFSDKYTPPTNLGPNIVRSHS
ncbi:MAG: hypothetical protein ACOCUV_02285, partial [bacterium]